MAVPAPWRVLPKYGRGFFSSLGVTLGELRPQGPLVPSLVILDRSFTESQSFSTPGTSGTADPLAFKKGSENSELGPSFVRKEL